MNKKLNRFGIVALFVVIFLGGVFCFIFFPNPFKATDPYYSSFKPENFKFEDYGSSICIREEVLAKLFPAGSKKAFIEKILVEVGGASAKVAEGIGHYNYFYKPKNIDSLFVDVPWSIDIHYDQNDSALSIRIMSREVYDFYKHCQLGKSYGRKWK